MTVAAEPVLKTCFVAMPISDMEPYEAGHFARVYEYVIKPACIAQGFKPLRADEVQNTNLIVADVIKRIVESDLMIVDLSGRNPNVLYELGIRQAFNLPTVLIKDILTPRIFDVQGLRDVGYDESLRIDSVSTARSSLEAAIQQTYRSHSEGAEEYNSLISLIKIKAAKPPEEIEVSPDTGIILQAVESMSSRMSILEEILLKDHDNGYSRITTGVYVYHSKFGAGKVVRTAGSGDKKEATVAFKNKRIRTLVLKFANLQTMTKEAYDQYAPQFVSELLDDKGDIGYEDLPSTAEVG